MSIESPVGTLDIKNATLRVGKLEVSNIQGIDTALNVTRANSVLIYDDQASTTTFNGTTSSAGVRDTVNGYLDVSTGYVYWGQKLPNSWVMEFEMDIRSGTNAGSLNLNVFSSINTGSDGYSIVFDDNGDNIILKYDGATIATAAVSGLFTASENWQKVVINYERGTMIIGIGGERKLYFQDIERETPYTTGEYINFSSASADGRKIRDLKITNGSKWIYAGESNVVYTQGSVGVGVTDPTTALDVSGTVKATALEGDGSAITNISSANVGDFASNVTRIETLETDLSSNATRVSTLETDLGSNVTRIGTLETGNMTISGQKTFSGDVIFESNVHMQGDVFVANTVNMTVSDPIIELGSNNLNTGDLGIIMTRHGATNSNIAIVFDESADVLRMGYTLGGASDADITLDSNVLAVSVQGALTAASVSGDGSGLSSIQSSNVSDFASNVGRIGTLETDLISNVGRIGTLETDLTSNVGRIGTLETDLTSNVTRITNLESSDMTIGGEKTFSSNLQVGTANLFVDTTTSNVGVGTSTPGYALDVVGDINLSGDFYQGGSIFVSSLWTSGNGSLYYDASNVGIGTNTANYELDVVGNVNATTLLANTAQIHSNLTVGSNVTIDDTASNVISVDGNIKADTFNVGDFVVVAAYGLDHVTNENNSTGDTIISTNPITGFRTLSNIVANGNVTATDLLCNTLTMNLVSFTGLQTFDQVTNVGNTTSNTVQFTNTNTSLVTLGNVGIGTANPGALLELSKATGSATISPTELRLSTRTNAADWSVTDPWARLAFYTNDVTGDAPGVMASVGAVASSVNGGENTRLAFFTAEPHVERMCVDRYGRVGIGTTNPSGELHVRGENMYLQSALVSNCTWRIMPQTGNSTKLFRIYDQDNSADRLVINASGNVGIGTASPNTALEVYSTTGTQLTLRSNSRYSTIYGVDDTGSCFFGNDGGQFRITTGGDTSGTGASERMRVDSSGNVGIGTASPQSSLHVYGARNNTPSVRGFHAGYNSSGDQAIELCAHTNVRNSYIDFNYPGVDYRGRILYGHSTERFDISNGGVTHFRIDRHSDATRLALARGNDGSIVHYINGGADGINSAVGSAGALAFWNAGGGGQMEFFGNFDSVSNKRHGYINSGRLYMHSTINANNSGVNFTGQHRTFIKDQSSVTCSKLHEGLIVSACNDQYIRMDSGIATGAEAITINECLPVVSLSNVAYDKMCFGVVSLSEDPEKREATFGSFIQPLVKEKGDTRVFINSLGEGGIWVTNINGNIESGDYITTSNVVGYGMRQDDDVLHNYTVAKSTMSCDFDPITQSIKQIIKQSEDVTYYYKWVEIDESIYIQMTENNEENKKNEDGKYYRRDETTEYKEGWETEVRQEMVNVLDEHGQLQWEDHPTETEKAYKIRYLTADGTETDEANAVHIAAFVGCTYHCG